MPFPIDSESIQVYEEGRSVLGSLINRLIAIAHMIIDHVIKLSKQFIAYMSENPLAMTLLMANIMVWVS